MTAKQTRKQMGHRGRNRQQAKVKFTETKDLENPVWTVQDTTVELTEEDIVQPEIEIGGDQSLFTRVTDPYNPW